MAAIPGSVDTEQTPPMTVPLRHFLVGLAMLVGGLVVGGGLAIDVVPGFGSLAQLHLLLVGWVCVTIMGAMTQFVPVWSGVSLHSQRIANAQLVAVCAGLIVFVGGLVTTELWLLLPGGALMLCGFWLFAYNIGRTLSTTDALDVTEQQFAIALGFFLVVTTLGVLLATHYHWHVAASLPVTHGGIVGAHATLAVFGGVLTTIYGALYQLATMFTQTDLDTLDQRLQPLQTAGHPVGVVLLAGGRLFEVATVARVGGLLVCLAALAFGTILLRKLWAMQAEPTPMHSRYAVVGVSLLAWALLTAPVWFDDPLSITHLLGGAAGKSVLLLGVVGFVIVGSLYHIIPFIVWLHSYSDKLGLEDVPMIDDLYNDRIAAVDGTLLVVGTCIVVASPWLYSDLVLLGGGMAGLGVIAFVTNMLLVLVRHSTQPLGAILFGQRFPRRTGRSTAPNDSS